MYLEPDHLSYLDRDGEMSALIRKAPWRDTPLGDPSQWPQSLHSVLSICLQTPAVSAVFWGPEFRMLYNDTYVGVLGDKHPWALGRPFAEVWPELMDLIGPQLEAAMSRRQVFVSNTQRLMMQRYGGLQETHWVYSLAPITGEDKAIVGIFNLGTEITQQVLMQRRQDEARDLEIARRTRERELSWQLSRDLLAVVDADGRILSANAAWATHLGRDEADCLGQRLADWTHPDDADAVLRRFADVVTTPLTVPHEYRLRHRDGSYRWFACTAAFHDGALYGVWRNTTTEREQAALLARSQEALRQSQKMEAVGQLTGGVAHDFNNLLQVIAGNLQLVIKFAGNNERVLQRVASAQGAVQRGAKLSAQLLAFSRRQPLEPKVIDVGRLALGMDDLLRRSLGETVQVEIVVAGALWNTLADPAQLENAILNLAINARDAMDGAGKLTIDVHNSMLDDAYVLANPDTRPGQYVTVAVTDTGAGMSPEVMAQAFEPFFTTKPVGQGTGLGLSMVYGFLRQSGGNVKIYSELGHGTTIKLYLPRSLTAAADPSVDAHFGPIEGGVETILVAEDDDAVRATSVALLAELGYRVLQASDADGALAVVNSGITIDLLFTDVVMPGSIKAPELARLARERQPNIAVLFTSGYTANAIVHGGRLDPGVELLGKPYTGDALARKVRHVLAHQAMLSLANPPPTGTPE